MAPPGNFLGKWSHFFESGAILKGAILCAWGIHHEVPYFKMSTVHGSTWYSPVIVIENLTREKMNWCFILAIQQGESTES